MTFWSRSHSLQRKIIMAIVMVGLLPLTFLLGLTYFEERRALRETTGINFKEVAVDAARRIEMHVTRVMNEGQQLATTPFLRTAVTEANRTYEGKDAYRVQEMIKDWQQRWKQRDKRSEFPLFINRIVTNYLIRWHDIRKADYVGILVTTGKPPGGRHWSGEPVKSPMSVKSPSIPRSVPTSSWSPPRFWTIFRRRLSEPSRFCSDEIRCFIRLQTSPSGRPVMRCFSHLTGVPSSVPSWHPKNIR
jgi:hypothetical protein